MVSDSSDDTIIIRVLNWLFLLAVFIVNGLAASLPLNGKTPKQLSDLYPTFITPAGYVFSIWGVIYMFLTLFAIYQSFPGSWKDQSLRDSVGYLFVVNSVFNILWIISWHYQTPQILWITVVIISGVLVTLVVIYQRLSRERENGMSNVKYVCVFVGFSMYLAWLTVATLINAFVVFGFYPKTSDGRGMENAVIAEWLGNLAILMVAIFSFYFGYFRKDPIPSFVYFWALIGIFVQQMGDSKPLSVQIISVSCSIVSAIVGFTSLFLLVKESKQQRQREALNPIATESAE